MRNQHHYYQNFVVKLLKKKKKNKWDNDRIYDHNTLVRGLVCILYIHQLLEVSAQALFYLPYLLRKIKLMS